MLLYLPPYSPDLNPIEESFSTCIYILNHDFTLTLIYSDYLGKAHLRRHGVNLWNEYLEDPILVLMDSVGYIVRE
jgi:transposase